ncbi:MAG: hypothetical protein II288_00480 [Alistipes sp.]|nr:hypothetical protein [Alistipes sp.]
MRTLLSIFVVMLLWCGSAEAQNIRLGEKIPDIHVISDMGEKLELIDTECVCLIFVHAESKPSINAVHSFRGIAEALGDEISFVLLFYEEPSPTSIENFYLTENTTIATDYEHRTFHNFEINYVPYAVIYEKRRDRALWFGSTQQLNQEMLKQIIETSK